MEVKDNTISLTFDELKELINEIVRTAFYENELTDDIIYCGCLLKSVKWKRVVEAIRRNISAFEKMHVVDASTLLMTFVRLHSNPTLFWRCAVVSVFGMIESRINSIIMKMKLGEYKIEKGKDEVGGEK